MSSIPDFYMSSADLTGEWAKPRACWVERRLRGPFHDQYALLKISPPGLPKGHTVVVDKILVSPHHENTTLFPVSADPLPVYVYTATRDDAFDCEEISAADVRIEAWCELYSRKEDAVRVAADA
jgi:hypothetical protein